MALENFPALVDPPSGGDFLQHRNVGQERRNFWHKTKDGARLNEARDTEEQYFILIYFTLASSLNLYTSEKS